MLSARSGASECRWIGPTRITQSSEWVVCYSGNDDGEH